MVLCLTGGLTALADGINNNPTNTQTAAKVKIDTNPLSDITADSAIVVECNTETVLSKVQADKKYSISHLAKLMTLLLAVEKIDAGKLSYNDVVTTSNHANSMGGTQIWLNVGEKIKIDELIKGIVIGNANDACVVLAEQIAGTEEDFVKLMNERAKELGMKKTHFVDCTGMNKETVSTARDLSKLSVQLLKHTALTPYFTTWIDHVRNQAVELVNTNRLVRTYKGITGLKSCSSAGGGEFLIATAKRGEMEVCVVLINSKTSDDKFAECKKAFDTSFSAYEIYTPEIDNKVFDKVIVNGGESLFLDVKISNLTKIIIPKGTYRSISSSFTKKDKIDAPVKKGQQLGQIVYKMNDKTILKSNIVAKNSVNKIGVKFALKKALLNLLNM